MFKSTRTNNKNLETAVSALGALQREMLVYGHQNYNHKLDKLLADFTYIDAVTYALLMVGEILGQYRDHGPIRARLGSRGGAPPLARLRLRERGARSALGGVFEDQGGAVGAPPSPKGE